MMFRMTRNFPTCALVGALFASAAGLAAAPVVPAYERFKDDGHFDQATLGEVLLGELNCATCHSPEEAAPARIVIKSAPDMSKAGARLTPQYIRAFLNAPHEVKPGTTMPDIFHASEGFAKSGAIDFLTHYLVSLGGPIKNSAAPISQSTADSGRRLFHSVGCAACHAPEKAGGIATPSVPLGRLAMKTTVEELTKFLMNPEHVRASGRMPNLGLAKSEARSIAIYLLRDQMTNPQSNDAKPVAAEGLRFEYYEQGFKKLPDFDALKPKATGLTKSVSLKLPGTKVRADGFAVRYTGELKIEKKGKHRFWLKSDDGSRLLIDGKKLVDVDGIHPAQEKSAEIMLGEGAHEIEVQYFEAGGHNVLNLQWKAPRSKRGEIPSRLLSATAVTPMVPLESERFTIDPGKAKMGRQMFAMLRCVSCHKMEGLAPLRPAKALADLNLDSPIGCVSPGIRRGLPHFRLSDGQRSALKAALKGGSGFAQPLKPGQLISRSLATMNCYACHDRHDIGGPDEKRKEHFTTNIEIDLGDEGRLPPTLTGVGSKLQEKALRAIVTEGKHHIRYFMSTRMPRFPKGAVEPLMAALIREDRKENDLKAPEFSEIAVKDGQHLVGIDLNSLGCVNCHNANGGLSAGIPGVDLASVHERLTPGWFHRYLLNPLAFKKETRMPSFWPDGKSLIKDIAGGDTHKQIDAIWTYLALGKSMPLPKGVQLEGGVGEELIPVGEPIVHRTFMQGVGPRSILVGFPERVHAAFDANVVRLAKLWRGRFFDGSGVSSGRTDKFFDPLGTDVIDLPPGPALAFLDKPESPWPVADLRDRNIGGRFRGYGLESATRQPTFRYQLRDVGVEERIEPVLKPGGTSIVRALELRSDVPVQGLWFLAGAGKKIAKGDDGAWTIDGKIELRLSGDIAEIKTRDGADGRELIVRPEFKGGAASIKTDIQW